MAVPPPPSRRRGGSITSATRPVGETCARPSQPSSRFLVLQPALVSSQFVVPRHGFLARQDDEGEPGISCQPRFTTGDALKQTPEERPARRSGEAEAPLSV